MKPTSYRDRRLFAALHESRPDPDDPACPLLRRLQAERTFARETRIAVVGSEQYRLVTSGVEGILGDAFRERGLSLPCLFEIL
jgi:hypothetical protein